MQRYHNLARRTQVNQQFLLEIISHTTGAAQKFDKELGFKWIVLDNFLIKTVRRQQLNLGGILQLQKF